MRRALLRGSESSTVAHLVPKCLLVACELPPKRGVPSEPCAELVPSAFCVEVLARLVIRAIFHFRTEGISMTVVVTEESTGNSGQRIAGRQQIPVRDMAPFHNCPSRLALTVSLGFHCWQHPNPDPASPQRPPQVHLPQLSLPHSGGVPPLWCKEHPYRHGLVVGFVGSSPLVQKKGIHSVS